MSEPEPQAEVEMMQPMALSSVDRELIDMQIATAKRYPRDVEKSMKRAVDAILSDPELAVDAFYEIPIAGSLINGFSVRSAEIVGQHWGNMRWEDRPVSVEPGANYVEGEAFAWDVENNVAARKIKRVSVVTKQGKRYPQHLIDTIQLKAQSVAKRDAISEVVGKAYVKAMHRKAEAYLDKDFPDFETRKDALAAAFKKLGVDANTICKFLTPPNQQNVKTWNLITHKDVFKLGNVYTSIKEGSATVKDVFGVEGVDPEKKKAPEVQKPTDDAAPDEKRAKLIEKIDSRLNEIEDIEDRGKLLQSVAERFHENPHDLGSWKEANLLGLAAELAKTNKAKS